MRMGCFCVPVVSVSFWVLSVIAACDLCDPRVLYEGEANACVRPCVFFFFACELTRESRTKLGPESRGFVLLPELGNHAHLRFGSQEWFESDLSEPDSKNTAGIQQSVWRGLGFFLPARILPTWVFRPSQRNIRCIAYLHPKRKQREGSLISHLFFWWSLSTRCNVSLPLAPANFSTYVGFYIHSMCCTLMKIASLPRCISNLRGRSLNPYVPPGVPLEF